MTRVGALTRARMGLVVLLGAAGFAACSGEEPGVGAQGVAAGGAFHAQTLASLEEAGLAVGRFAAEPGELTCARGPIEGLEVLLCKAGADQAVTTAAAKKFVDGAVNGAVREVGPWVIAVADRDKSDMQGKRINKILKTFQDPALDR